MNNRLSPSVLLSLTRYSLAATLSISIKQGMKADECQGGRKAGSVQVNSPILVAGMTGHDSGYHQKEEKLFFRSLPVPVPVKSSLRRRTQKPSFR